MLLDPVVHLPAVYPLGQIEPAGNVEMFRLFDEVQALEILYVLPVECCIR